MSKYTTTFLQSQEAREELSSYIQKLTDFVRTSYGPIGKKTVVYDFDEAPNIKPLITNDGVTILRTYIPENELESLAKSILLETATKVEKEVGDGTTTSIILAGRLTEQLLKLRNSGESPIAMIEELEKLKVESKKIVKEYKQEVKTKKDLYNLAYTTSRNEELSRLLSEAYYQIGEDASMEIIENVKPYLETEIHEAVVVEESFKDRSFAQDEETMKTEIDNPLVLLTNKKISKNTDLASIAKDVPDRNILLFCSDIDGEALNSVRQKFAYYKTKGTGNFIYPIQVPHSLNSEQSLTILEDLSALTGAEIIDVQRGGSLLNITKDQFGEATKVQVGLKSTKIFGCKADEERVKERMSQVEMLEDEIRYVQSLEFLAERKRMLSGRYAALKIGAQTDVEAMSLWKVAEDTVGVLKSAYKEGVLPGGGAVLLKVSDAIERAEPKSLTRNTFRTVLMSPFGSLCELSEISIEEKKEIGRKIIEGDRAGYNFKTRQFVDDILKEGVIDSFGSVYESIDKAISLAKTLLSVENIVINKSSPSQSN